MPVTEKESKEFPPEVAADDVPGASDPASTSPADNSKPDLIAQQTKRELFDVLVAEDANDEAPNFGNKSSSISTAAAKKAAKGLFHRPVTLGSVANSASTVPRSFFERMIDSTRQDKDVNRYQDFSEGRRMVLSPNLLAESLPESKRFVKIPTLRECQNAFSNEEAEISLRNSRNPFHQIARTFLNIFAAFYIWIAQTLNFETVLIVTNATLVTLFYCYYAERYSAKLDFSILSFSVVFPLTFLIQSTFSRRDQALQHLADFRSCVLSTALFTFTVDWPDPDVPGSFTGGRRLLPDSFNEASLDDFRRLFQLVYEYLSMPSVSHARHVAFWHKQPYKRRVHAKQNDIIKRYNDAIFDFTMHTEEMRKAGFPSGEASRLQQYHQYLEQRFEHLRTYKYYRTPQATRSFGRVYIYVLPWMAGPYFAWVYEEQLGHSYAFTLTLAGFTFLVLQGLLNTQQGLEDPFLVDYTSWTPGIDTLKLDYEMAVGLQAVEQYYAEAQIRAVWEEKERERKEQKRKLKEAAAAAMK